MVTAGDNPTPPGLLFHKVTPRWDAGVGWTTPGLFRRQILALQRRGWSGSTPSEWTQNPERGRFILAFDDGYEDLERHALPVCQEASFRGVIFIPANFIGRSNEWDHRLFFRRFQHLSLDALRRFLSEGWEIGSHGLNHRPLSLLGSAEARRELIESKHLLENLLGQEVKWFSFPFSRYNTRCLEYAAEAGYAGAIAPVIPGHLSVGEGFNLWQADAVYLWDGPAMVCHRLNRGAGYRIGRTFRKSVNALANGTILWNRFVKGRA